MPQGLSKIPLGSYFFFKMELELKIGKIISKLNFEKHILIKVEEIFKLF